MNMPINYEDLKSLDISLPYKTKLFLNMLSRLEIGSLHLELPDGEKIVFQGNQAGPVADLKINSFVVINRLLSSSDIGLAEAYRDGLVETADLTNLLLLACLNQDALEKTFQGSFFGMIFYRIRHLLRFNSRKGSKKNIQAHYDLGNSFYQLWLDSTMSYSSAIFKDKNEDLKSAQINKYQKILDSLQVKAGDHILEIGCGWGGFAILAAKTTGAKVTCLTLSLEQHAYLQDLIKKEHLESQITVKICDYRDEQGIYDHIVSIEMIEAVGEKYWNNYFQTIFERLKFGGKAHIQSITIKDELFDNYRSSTDFIQQYIFPGGMMLTPAKIQQKALEHHLSVNDYFEFGLDYAETLKRWRESFHQQIEKVKAQGFDDAFIKIWDFYYCYCEAGFLSQRINVAQVLMEKK